MSWGIAHGDCLEVLASLPENSVDAIITDPPYGLSDHKPEDVQDCLRAWIAGEEYKPKKKGFMGKSWDAWVPGPEVWKECYRVLKPGGHMAVFAGTRSQDLMGMAIRLAGFEIRENICWTYGSGFPKSMNVSKMLDKMAGAEREVVGKSNRHKGSTKDTGAVGDFARYSDSGDVVTAPATDEAKKWDGWGTALKPAHEPIIVARKPLIGTVAENVLKYGTGAINIDGCRVGYESLDDKANATPQGKCTSKESESIAAKPDAGRDLERVEFERPEQRGRFPANLILSHHPDCKCMGTQRVKVNTCGVDQIGMGRDGNHTKGIYGAKGSKITTAYADENGLEEVEVWECVEGCPMKGFPLTKSGCLNQANVKAENNIYGQYGQYPDPKQYEADSGSASRFFKHCDWEPFEYEEAASFFYTAKASRSERNAGLGEDFEEKSAYDMDNSQTGPRLQCFSKDKRPGHEEGRSPQKNTHPCLLPNELVLTTTGFEPISQVKPGSLVLSHDGLWHTVIDAFASPCSGTVVTLKVDGLSGQTQATTNHPFLIARPVKKGKGIKSLDVQWTVAGELLEGDYLMTPRVQEKETESPDVEWAWIAGLWVAEGTVLSNSHGTKYPSFSLNAKETHFVERIRKRFPEVSVKVYPKPDCEGILVVLFKHKLVDAYLNLFGSGSHDKHLSPSIWSWGKEARLSLLQGYLDGDGWRRKREIRAKTVSPYLVSLLEVLAQSVGWFFASQYRDRSNTKTIQGRQINGGPYWEMEFRPPLGRLSRPREITWQGTDYVLRRLKKMSIREYEGPVWNLTVEDTHTFQTLVGMSHNTVKPLSLMRYLCRMFCPPEGLILDPFTGSGSTGCAAVQEGMSFAGIEQEEQYIEIAKARIRHWKSVSDLPVQGTLGL
ncbi:MAG: DNA methyltransferase [Patescibacteria group bacterium]